MASMIFHVTRDGEAVGEFEERDFQQKIFSGEIQPEDYYWREGFDDWKAVSEYRASAKTTVIAPRHSEAATALARAQNTLLKKLKRSPPLRILVIGFAGLMFLGFLADQCGKSGVNGRTSRGAPRVRAGASDFALRVTNEGTENWNTMVVYVNGRPPFTYKWEGTAPAIGKSVTIPLTEFAKENGERFEISRMKVVEVWVGGDGFDYLGLHF